MDAPCPVCREPAAPPSANPNAPFCSERCRLLDLSAWLDERYAIPSDPVPTDASSPANTPDESDDPDDGR